MDFFIRNWVLQNPNGRKITYCSSKRYNENNPSQYFWLCSLTVHTENNVLLFVGDSNSKTSTLTPKKSAILAAQLKFIIYLESLSRNQSSIQDQSLPDNQSIQSSSYNQPLYRHPTGQNSRSSNQTSHWNSNQSSHSNQSSYRDSNVQNSRSSTQSPQWNSTVPHRTPYNTNHRRPYHSHFNTKTPRSRYDLVRTRLPDRNSEPIDDGIDYDMEDDKGFPVYFPSRTPEEEKALHHQLDLELKEYLQRI